MKKLNQIVMLLLTSIILASCSCLENVCIDPIGKFEKSNHRIDLERSKTLYKNYNNRLRKPIMEFQKEDIKRTNDEYNPTKYVLINIDTLECYLKFLREVEKKNKGKGVDKKITGIAVFLGAQSKTARIENKAAFNKLDKEEKEERKANGEYSDEILSNEDIRGRVTMFLAPTYRDNGANIKSEVQRHIPFYIQPYNDLDPYVGDYESLIAKFEAFSRASFSTEESSSSTTETSLNSNEFTDMPPKKPIKD